MRLAKGTLCINTNLNYFFTFCVKGGFSSMKVKSEMTPSMHKCTNVNIHPRLPLISLLRIGSGRRHSVFLFTITIRCLRSIYGWREMRRPWINVKGTPQHFEPCWWETSTITAIWMQERSNNWWQRDRLESGDRAEGRGAIRETQRTSQKDKSQRKEGPRHSVTWYQK